MLQDRYLNKLKELPEPIRQFGGLVTITVIVILSFAILNIFWGQGEELVAKMKKEEERIAQDMTGEYPLDRASSDPILWGRLGRVLATVTVIVETQQGQTLLMLSE